MAAGVGSKVEYLDYNEIQTIVNNVFGIGSGDYGYGQTVTSSQVAQHSLVSVTQWNSLRNDLLKARQHQSGVDETGNLGLPTLDIKLSEADRAAYLSMATLINNNRTVAPPSGEASFVTLITSNRASGWTSTVNQTLTIEFGTANNIRWFFNAGGNFQVSSSLTNYATTGDSRLVNESWEVLLRNMGIIKLTNSSTSMTGTGTPATNIGFANLTSSNQLIFSRLVEGGSQYTPNQYQLYARISGGSALVLTPTWSYTDAGNDGSFRVFEPVIGTLNSICQMYIATGANVAVAYPQTQFSGTGWTYASAYTTPPPSYSIRPNVTLANEGNIVTYTVSTDNVPNGTVLYWKNLGSSIASDFTDGENSGTVTITADLGTVTRQIRADATTEFVNETIILQLLTGSVNGVPVATADTVTIIDISLTPISYAITANTPSQDEGRSIVYTITTTGVSDGTLVYWINVGTTSGADFPNAVNDGSVAIINGTATITRSAEADLTTEGTESIIIELRSGSVNGPLLATSATSQVVDVSTTPPVLTYDITPASSSVQEGNSLIFYVTTSNVPNGTVLYWTIATNASDFATSSGSITINANAGQFTVTANIDALSEGTESFSMSLRTNSINGEIVATSPTVSIADTLPPTITMGTVTPIGGYGATQQFSVPFSTVNATSVAVVSPAAPSSAPLSTSGSYTWNHTGALGVQAVTITATGTGGSVSATRNYTIYTPTWSITPQYPKVNQPFTLTVSGGIPNGASSWTSYSSDFVYLTSGSGNFTVPAGVTQLTYSIVGGGGGGSGGYQIGGRNNNYTFGDIVGGAGGSGGRLINQTLAVTPGQVIAYSVGAGGNNFGGPGLQAGVAGGTTTFGTASATGGAKGTSYNASGGGGNPADRQGTGAGGTPGGLAGTQPLAYTGGTASIGVPQGGAGVTVGAGGTIYGTGGIGGPANPGGVGMPGTAGIIYVAWVASASGSNTLTSEGSTSYAFSSGLNKVRRQLYYDVLLIGSATGHNTGGRIDTVIHPAETIQSSAGTSVSANTPFNITIIGGEPNVTFGSSVTTNSGAQYVYPFGPARFDLAGSYTFSGLTLPVGNYTFTYTFQPYYGAPYGEYLPERIRSIIITST
jgi:hypothetical protein